MYWSRSLEELHPRVAKKARMLVERCDAELDVTLVVICTYRDEEAERRLHEQGRAYPGRVLTYRWPTTSYHPWRMAFDVLPLWNGVPILQAQYPNERRMWKDIGRIGKELGLEWDGDSDRRRRELGHFQLTEGLTIDQLKAGKTL